MKTELRYEDVPEGIDELSWKSVMMSDDEMKRVERLSSKVKIIQCFEVEGVIFKGNSLRAKMDFVHNTTFPADFLYGFRIITK